MRRGIEGLYLQGYWQCVMEEVAPSLSGWLRRQPTDEEMYAQARASADG